MRLKRGRNAPGRRCYDAIAPDEQLVFPPAGTSTAGIHNDQSAQRADVPEANCACVRSPFVNAPAIDKTTEQGKPALRRGQKAALRLGRGLQAVEIAEDSVNAQKGNQRACLD